jgi:TRAP-type uncharacterized transport system fused permease subunit
MSQLGIEVLAGHMFLLYFAVMSALTPPVAVAAYAAASIAEDNPMVIAMHAVKLALAAFVVPFVFVFGPELLWKGPLWKTAITFGTAAIALVLLAAAIERHRWCQSWWARGLVAAGALGMVTPDLRLTASGAGLVALGLAAQMLQGRRQATAKG